MRRRCGIVLVSPMLGCTARRAGLGIHRSQAGRRGSSSGRGWRVVARRSTSTPSTDSATSATVPGRLAAGRCRPCAGPVPARARNHRHRPRPQLRARARCTTVTVTGPPQRPGSGAPPGTTKPGWGNQPPPPCPAAAASRDRCRPGGAHGPLSLRTSRSAGRHSGLRGSGSPDWIATAGPGAARPDSRGGSGPGPGRPEVTAEDAVYCAARAAVRVDTRASRGAGPPRPDWIVTAGPVPRARTQLTRK